MDDLSDHISNLLAGGNYAKADASVFSNTTALTALNCPNHANFMACMMVRERKFAQAYALFKEAARHGNPEALKSLEVLGWSVAVDKTGTLAKRRRFFLPSALALQHGAGADEYLVPDAFTGLCLRRILGGGSFQEVATERTHPEGLKASASYLSAVTEQVMPLLAERLDAIHGSQLGIEFWRRALGMSLDRHLTLVYDHFVAAESALAVSDVHAVMLDPACFYMPVDYDDLHWFLSDRDFGQEQLFSMYCSYFHSGRFPFYQQAYHSDYVQASPTPPTPYQPIVGILGSWFKEQWSQQLATRSGYEIQRIGYDRLFTCGTTIDFEKRTFLAQPAVELDRFSNFFLSTFTALFPRTFVEDWRAVYGSIMTQMSLYRRLKYVVSELWIGDAIEPIVLAILMQQGVKTIYHEHNYSEHPFVASALPRWSKLCDIYMAHGAHSILIRNGVQGGSLYDFGEERQPRSHYEHRILYVSGLAFMKDSLLSGSSALAGNGFHAIHGIQFKRKFLDSLEVGVRKYIHYRGYPKSGYGSNWKNCQDDMTFLEDLLVDSTRDDLSRSCKEVMAASRLVVVAYLATTHLESLSMNIPTILLFPAPLGFLDVYCRDFFDPLITVGICQTDPQAAAEFLVHVADAPEEWWFSSEVQEARKTFLARALGDPQKSINLLVDLAVGRPAY